jgi:uncharacterized DUF497 family protein
VRFSWDPEKSDASFHDRGFDFDFASLIFEEPTLEREDTRQDYGERRIIAIGLAAGVELTVCLHRPPRCQRRGGPPNHFSPPEQSS